MIIFVWNVPFIINIYITSFILLLSCNYWLLSISGPTFSNSTFGPLRLLVILIFTLELKQFNASVITDCLVPICLWPTIKSVESLSLHLDLEQILIVLVLLSLVRLSITVLLLVEVLIEVVVIVVPLLFEVQIQRLLLPLLLFLALAPVLLRLLVVLAQLVHCPEELPHVILLTDLFLLYIHRIVIYTKSYFET